jgi:hypothetical protein
VFSFLSGSKITGDRLRPIAAIVFATFFFVTGNICGNAVPVVFCGVENLWTKLGHASGLALAGNGHATAPTFDLLDPITRTELERLFNHAIVVEP